ncbi:MAG: tetratricopeptide repeat protein, partial [Gemmatimonadota bacterium]
MRTRAQVVVLTAVLLLPLPALAQQRVPLQKSDLIRLLSGETYSKSEVATIIRQNCLTFAVSERDRTDLQALGATAEVIQAIDDCERQANSVSLALSARSIAAPAGGRARFVVDLTRGGLPVTGARVQLVGSGRVAGGTGTDLVVRSNEVGRAVFQIPAGTVANTYTLTVAVSGETTLGASTVTLQTRPGPVSRAVADPTELVADADPERRTVTIRLTDEYGNAVAGAVQVNTDTTATSRIIASTVASQVGEARVTIPIDDLAGSSSLGIFAAGQLVGTIGVGQGGADEASTQFVSGTGQTAEAGQSLARLLVLEVRDASGAPLVDQEVRFSVMNGRVNPEVIGTDTNGQVATRVTLGSQGGLTEVQATVGSIQRNTSFESVAGAALDDNLQALLVEARRKFAAGNARGARAAYQEILEANPRNVDAQAGLAESLLATGRAEQAVRWYEVIVSSAPGDADVWVALGSARAAAGQPDGAKVAYETAIALDPDRQDAR